MTKRPGALWAAPAIAYFAVFAVAPMALVACLSLTTWNGLGVPQWAGTANWARLGDDAALPGSLRLSAILTVAAWCVQTPLSLLLGVWAAGPGRGRAALSAVFFVPLLMSNAAVALLWQSLLDPAFGLADLVGPLLAARDGNILGEPSRALAAVVLVVSWQFVPFHVLLYQAATRQIPAMLYDAAAIDGAGRVRRFVSITLPQLRNTIVSSTVLILVGSFTYFETILLMTGGGPGTATRVLPLHMYLTGFSAFEMGYASTLAVLLVAVGTTLSIVIVRATGFARMRSTREGL
ncbi:carbohydrate ABC transporter permease [Actinomadura rugatobispora]|uniref:Carbohydrate ABC transporter permease n=1 Tax=Actinomadura rugatobispora TaxID=1994 RepID=A0ABW1A4H9_9ACTN|nr:sugar ABC transporter permease [Actinomadura rugatobispora]